MPFGQQGQNRSFASHPFRLGNLRYGGALYAPTIFMLARDGTIASGFPIVPGSATKYEKVEIGADLTYGATGLKGIRQSAIIGGGADFLRIAAAAAGDIGAGDVVAYVMFETGPSLVAGSFLYDKRDANEGVSIYLSPGTGAPTFYMAHLTVVSTVTAAGLVVSTRYQAMVLVDRNEASANGALWWLSAGASPPVMARSGAGADFSARAGNIASAARSSLVADDTGGSPHSGKLIMLGLWELPAGTLPGGAANVTAGDAIAASIQQTYA